MKAILFLVLLYITLVLLISAQDTSDEVQSIPQTEQPDEMFVESTPEQEIDVASEASEEATAEADSSAETTEASVDTSGASVEHEIQRGNAEETLIEEPVKTEEAPQKVTLEIPKVQEPEEPVKIYTKATEQPLHPSPPLGTPIPSLTKEGSAKSSSATPSPTVEGEGSKKSVEKKPFEGIVQTFVSALASVKETVMKLVSQLLAVFGLK